MTTLRALALLALCTACASSAESPPPDPAAVFEKIELGATRAEVEALVGPDALTGLELGDEVWYFQPPVIEMHESPWGPGGIKVTYEDGRVVAKQLNPQVR